MRRGPGAQEEAPLPSPLWVLLSLQRWSFRRGQLLEVLGLHGPLASSCPAPSLSAPTPTPSQLQLSGDPWTAVIRLDIWLWPTFFTCYLPYVFNKILLPSSHAFHVIF